MYHNPRCTKSRETLALLRARGIEPELVLYLEMPLSVAELEGLVAKLGLPAQQLVRTKEDAYALAGLSNASGTSEILHAIVAAPSLLERPIVVVGARAAIGRPPENVLQLLDSPARR
jgi:arsenate reductase